MAISFNDLMKGFGIVTVMNACIFLPKKAYTAAKNCQTVADTNGYYNAETGGMEAGDFVPAYEYIDTLKIANFTQEGPTKTVSGGQYANPLIKYGKTMTAEIQDALGRASTLERFFGVDYDGYAQVEGTVKEADETVVINLPKTITADGAITVRVNGAKMQNTEYTVTAYQAANGDQAAVPAKVTVTLPQDLKVGDNYIVTVYCEGSRLSVTDKFPGPFAIEGDTFFIDQKTGEKKHVFIFIPQFIPDAILTLTQDAEGDATVFDLNGSVAVTDIKDEDGSRSIFYEIREKSFFAEQRKNMDI